jgi:hypothetical protein
VHFFLGGAEFGRVLDQRAQFSRMFAMPFQLVAGKLSLGDAALGSMMLDPQSTALLATIDMRDGINATTHLLGI